MAENEEKTITEPHWIAELKKSVAEKEIERKDKRAI